jgi:hypothetical protein
MTTPLNNDWTHIGVLIDHSGSMQTLNPKSIAVELTQFIKNQKGGKVTVTTGRFDDTYEILYKSQEAKNVIITEKDIAPNGMTALNESFCRFIDDIGSELGEMTTERPGKVIIVVLTDGLENASKGKYGGDSGKAILKEKITHQKEVYNWVFFFMGTNFDAITVGKDFGIEGEACINFGATPELCSRALRTTSNKVEQLRSLSSEQMMSRQAVMQTAGYNVQERENCK